MTIKSIYQRFLTSVIVSVLLVSLFLVPLADLIVSADGGPGDWWDAYWPYRKAVTINHTKVEGILEEFPLLINITDIDLIDSQQKGDDIVFVDSSTGMKLNHEIEYFSRDTGHLVAWVNMPLLTADTKLYMYYGNPSAASQQNPSAVWNPGHKMVLHLDEKSGLHYDSTANSNNGTPYGGLAQGVPGKIDGGDSFDGVDDYIRVPHSDGITGFTAAFTVSFWLRLDDTTKRQTILNKYNTVGNQRAWFIEYQVHPAYGKVLSFSASQDGANPFSWYASFSPTSGESYYVTVVWESAEVPEFCVNGMQVSTIGSTATITSIFNNSGAPLDIGRSTYVTDRYLKGSLDEIRISNVAFSTSWVNASYNNQKDSFSFYTIGEEEKVPESPPFVYSENPQAGAMDVYLNPTLSIQTTDVEGDLLTVVFSTNATGIWQDTQTYTNAGDGTYTWTPTDMNVLATKYYWGVAVTDGSSWTNKTFSFTTAAAPLALKWKATKAPKASTGVLIADVNGDSREEVIYAGAGRVVVLNGTNGKALWDMPVEGVTEAAQPEMADLNKDGILEIVVPIENPAGLNVLFANNGSTFWRRTDLGGYLLSDPVIADIEGDGYPTIFVASMWPAADGLNSSGRITSLTYDGHIMIHQTFSWHPCAGGLSLADTDNDGEFELYLGDRHMYFETDQDYGKGVRSFWAKNLTLRWEYPDIICSSHRPMLADVNKDGVLEVVVGSHRGGVAVLDSRDGGAIRKTLNIPDDAPVHYQPSIYDIDGDGNLEMLMADGEHDNTANDVVIWDLVNWQVDARIPIRAGKFGPQIADVTGDGIMDIIICNYTDIFVYDRNYTLVAQVRGLVPRLMYAVVQDIDGDSANEMVVASENGIIYAFDTPARRPTPRARSEVRFYSERRLGVAEFVPPSGRSEPIVSAPSPSDGATDVSIALSQLSFTLTDLQYDLMNYSVTTTPNVGSDNGTNVDNGVYTAVVSNLEYNTTYAWKISVTDGNHWTTKTFAFVTEAAQPWWNVDWQYRRKITIDPTRVGSNQASFPVLLEFAESSLIGRARSDGYDFVFTDSSQNKLDHELEFYNGSTGQLVAWVNLPILSSTTYTKIYMYYGNPNASNQQNHAAVWSNSYKMVLHLDEKSGLHYDSTANSNNGTPYGGLAQGVPGKIDGGDSFDGVDDYIRVPHSDGITGFTAAFTVSFWLRLDDTTKRQTILNKYNTVGNQRAWFIEYQVHPTYGKVLDLFLSPDGATSRDHYASFSPTAGEWYYITVVWESAKVPRFYINGAQVKTKGVATITSIFNNSGAPLDIGRSTYVTDRYLKGSLDEIRISNIARSASWILTDYSNQKDVASFLTIGSEEELPEAPDLTALSPFNGATNVPASLSQLNFRVTDYQGSLMNYTVSTYPDIGFGSAINVGNGRYVVSVGNLAHSTTYTWFVNVTDGINWTNKTFTFTTESEEFWWNTSWRYRKVILIDPAKVSGDQTSFPVLIELTDTGLIGRARSDGYDFVFTDSSQNKLDHELEFYNGSTGQLVAWVNLPLLSSTTYTELNLYYGNPSAANQQNPAVVWDPGYKMVLHLDARNGARYDSTANGNNGTPFGGLAQGVLGKTDGADSFDGLDDYIGVPHSDGITGFTAAFTVSFWLRLDDTTKRQTILNKYNTVGNQRAWFIEYLVSSKYGKVLYFYISSDGAHFKSYYASFSPTAGEWYYITVVWESAKVPRFYINGAQVKTKGVATITSIFNNSGAPLDIGRSTYVTDRYLKGSLDEIRISNIARSASWILTCYNNQKDPSSFYNIGNQETLADGPVISVPCPLDGTTRVPLSLSQLSFNLVNYLGSAMEYTVTTSPDIGSGSGINVFDGRYSLYIEKQLAPSTTYTWTVCAKDGTKWANYTYTFTTFPGASPIQDIPLLVSSGGTNKTDENLMVYNQTTYDPDNDKITNIYNWYRNNTSITNLLLPFNTNSSIIAEDYSGYGNDGVIVGGVTWVIDGKVGGAYKFDTGYIQIPGTSTLDGGGQWSEITVEQWIYITTYRSTRTIAKIPSYEIGISWNKIFAGIWIDTGVWNVSGYNRVTCDTPLEKNTWYHIAFTYKNGTGLTLYINGVAVANTPVSGKIQTSGTEPIYLGWFDYFKGIIDEVGIYPKSLSPQQIHQRYLETKDGLSNSSTIAPEETEVGDVWKCQVTPNDSYQDGIAKFSNTVTIVENNPPQAYNLTITPSTPYTNDNLEANYTYSDADGDSESGTEVRWYRNGILQPELNNTLTVPYDLTKKGDIWYFTIRPSDGKAYGILQSSQPETIQNSPPTIDSFSPEDTTLEIKEGETIQFAHTSSDLDDDNTLTYLWLLDGIEQSRAQNWTYQATTPGTFNITLVVSDGELLARQQWNVAVNAPPNITSYYPSDDPTIFEGQSQEFNVTYFDPDGDTLTIQWYVNGSLVEPSPGDSYTYEADLAGTYIVTVIVSDGLAQTSHQWTLTAKQPET